MKNPKAHAGNQNKHYALDGLMILSEHYSMQIDLLGPQAARNAMIDAQVWVILEEMEWIQESIF